MPSNTIYVVYLYLESLNDKCYGARTFSSVCVNGDKLAVYGTHTTQVFHRLV